MPDLGGVCINYNVVGWKQPKTWACWYTSLQIVINYFRNGGQPAPATRLIDPSEDPETKGMYQRDEGIAWTANERVAHKLGFSTLAACLNSRGMTDLLVSYGPIIYSGRWPGSSTGHWVVITGVSGDEITIYNPSEGYQTKDYNDFFGKYLVEHELKPLIYAE
jgi:ABC-type bacteriocin/lantibiotic exporter with double-glycine peptidase domain